MFRDGRRDVVPHSIWIGAVASSVEGFEDIVGCKRVFDMNAVRFCLFAVRGVVFVLCFDGVWRVSGGDEFGVSPF